MTTLHCYESIAGFFTWPDYYRWVAKVVRPNAHLVEVGAYAGQSAAFLAVELVNRGDFVGRLDLVDRFEGGDPLQNGVFPPEVAGVIGACHHENSWDAARRYRDGSVDFVFIDADHSYESVRRDIDAWLPKIRKNEGIIAGHDFCVDFPGVIQAVTETFPRIEVHRGERWGDQRMRSTGQYYSVWSVAL